MSSDIQDESGSPAFSAGTGIARAPFGPRTLLILFVVASVILAAIPLVPELFGAGKNKDYPLWYWVGKQALTGGDIYSMDGRATFAFLYPPFAALMLAPFSVFGKAFSILCIVIVNLASWLATVRLSERLVRDGDESAWWVVALPSILMMPLILDTFNLGQPNLMLLAMVLAGLVLLQDGREWSAGAMFALATALKAFPVAVLPYLLWRRRWRAAGSMVALTAALLVLAPAPFRGFERNLQDLKTWSQGMVLSANAEGFGQRPEQNWSWQNNSVIAVTHRFLRAINSEAIDPAARPLYVNFANLTYQQANLAVLFIIALIGAGFVAVLPSEKRRSRRSDAAEFGILIALMTIASPLARGYYFVWLIFPLSVLVHRAVSDPRARARRATWGLLALAMLLLGVGGIAPKPHLPQALGILLWATALLIGALAWHLRRSSRPVSELPT